MLLNFVLFIVALELSSEGDMEEPVFNLKVNIRNCFLKVNMVTSSFLAEIKIFSHCLYTGNKQRRRRRHGIHLLYVWLILCFH